MDGVIFVYQIEEQTRDETHMYLFNHNKIVCTREILDREVKLMTIAQLIYGTVANFNLLNKEVQSSIYTNLAPEPICNKSKTCEGRYY
jgi:hypothetical protein